MIKLPKLWLPETRIQRHRHKRARRGSWWWCCCQEVPPPPGCIYFTDNFGDGVIDVSEWEDLLGTWSVVSGVARATESNSYLRARATTGSIGASSIVKIRSSGFNTAFVYTRASTVIGGFHEGAGAVLDFAQGKVKIVSSAPFVFGNDVIAECPYSLALNTFYTVRVCHHRIIDKVGANEVFRGIITVFIDGEPVLRAYDPDCAGWHLNLGDNPPPFQFAIATGQVDAGTYVEFDDVQATRLDPDGDPLCHECATCCWPYTEEPPDTITAQIFNLSSALNPCFVTANLCNTLDGASFQMTKTPYPYVEGFDDPNILIYFPCAYYTLGGLNIDCNGSIYNRVSLVVGVRWDCATSEGGGLIMSNSCAVEWRLWQDEGDTFYRSRAFLDFAKVARFVDFGGTGTAADALCGGFPLDLGAGPTTLATCIRPEEDPDSFLRLTTP